MKTLEETLDNVAKEFGWESFEEVLNTAQYQVKKQIILKAGEEFARLKSLYSIKNTRYKAIEICQSFIEDSMDSTNHTLELIIRRIHNINNEEVIN